MSVVAEIKGKVDFEVLQDDRMVCGIRNGDHVLQRLEGDEELAVFFNPNKGDFWTPEGFEVDE